MSVIEYPSNNKIEYKYAQCLLPPNYPVPAIPLELVFGIHKGKVDCCELVHIHPIDMCWYVAIEYPRH